MKNRVSRIILQQTAVPVHREREVRPEMRKKRLRRFVTSFSVGPEGHDPTTFGL